MEVVGFLKRRELGCFCLTERWIRADGGRLKKAAEASPVEKGEGEVEVDHNRL